MAALSTIPEELANVLYIQPVRLLGSNLKKVRLGEITQCNDLCRCLTQVSNHPHSSVVLFANLAKQSVNGRLWSDMYIPDIDIVSKTYASFDSIWNQISHFFINCQVCQVRWLEISIPTKCVFFVLL